MTSSPYHCLEPLSGEIEEQLKSTYEAVVKEEDFEEVPRRPRTVLEWLSDKLPPHLLASNVPRSWDLIGDIAMVEVPDELLGYEKLIAEAILAFTKTSRAST